MRQALAKLGNDAKTSDLQEYVKKNFGIAMDLNTTSAYKSSLTKKAKPEAGASKGAQPKTGPKAESPKHETISKLEGVRRALNEMGKEAMPSDIQGFLKKSYSISMSTGTISNYKTTLLKQTAGHKNGRRKARKIGRPKAAPTPAAAHVVDRGLKEGQFRGLGGSQWELPGEADGARMGLIQVGWGHSKVGSLPPRCTR